MTTVNYEYYVSLEVAKLLKEAGFDWECSKIYYCCREDGDTWELEDNYKNYKSILKLDHCLLTPTLEVAQRWLREVKGIYTMVFKDFATIDGWHYFVVKKEDWESGNESNFYQQESNNHTYEEAQEAGIKKALEIILEKGK